jgi:hypothetical protein
MINAAERLLNLSKISLSYWCSPPLWVSLSYKFLYPYIVFATSP